MSEKGEDRPIAPRRNLGGPVLPPPPPELAEQARAEAEQARAAEAEQKRKAAEREERQRDRLAAKESAAQKRREQQQAREQERAGKQAERDRRKDEARAAKEAAMRPDPAPARTLSTPAAPPARQDERRQDEPRQDEPRQQRAASPQTGKPLSGRPRTRRAQLRLVQVDAWSVMKTSFLLSIALGIVLVVAVAIIMSVLGAAGVWDSINSIVQQAVGNDSGQQFQIQDYVGFYRVLGITMVVAVADILLITAISTLGAFLYNLSAALLGGIEVTLAEDA